MCQHDGTHPKKGKTPRGMKDESKCDENEITLDILGHGKYLCANTG